MKLNPCERLIVLLFLMRKLFSILELECEPQMNYHWRHKARKAALSLDVMEPPQISIFWFVSYQKALLELQFCPKHFTSISDTAVACILNN